jgi:hypothetical protein
VSIALFQSHRLSLPEEAPYDQHNKVSDVPKGADEARFSGIPDGDRDIKDPEPRTTGTDQEL